MSFVKLKEKFKAMGLLPVKLVAKKSSHNLGKAANRTKLNKTGNITPKILIKLLKKSILSFLFSKSKCNINKKGIRKIEVGLIIILMPKIKLPINCQTLLL